MTYAPVLIPTLCRSEHFELCLESLANNKMASHTVVYVALDYPAKVDHKEGYHKICEYLCSFERERFKELRVIRRKKNYGAIKNLQEAKRVVFSQFDRIIISEDDNEFSTTFLEYMNSALDMYENDPRVDSICGYSYPLPWVVSDGANAFFCDSTFSAWGYGTWKNKSEHRESLIESGWLVSEFERAAKDGALSRMTENRRDECIVYAGMEIRPDVARWPSDFMNGIYLAYSNVCTVVPTESKVRNHGFDGTGLFCSKISDASGSDSQDYDYATQKIDSSLDFKLKVDERFSSGTENGRLLDSFLFVPKKLKTTASLGFLLFRMFGINGIRLAGRIYRRIRNIVKG